MINQFTQTVKRINQEVLALKTNRLRTASAIATDTYSQAVELEWQYQDFYGVEYAFIRYNIYTNLANNNPAFSQLMFSGIQDWFNNGDDFDLSHKPPLTDGFACTTILIYAGSDEQSIINRLKNGERVVLNTTLTATATEEITGIRLEKLPWPQ